MKMQYIKIYGWSKICVKVKFIAINVCINKDDMGDVAVNAC